MPAWRFRTARTALDTGALDVVVLTHFFQTHSSGLKLGRVPGQEEQLQPALSDATYSFTGRSLVEGNVVPGSGIPDLAHRA